MVTESLGHCVIRLGRPGVLILWIETSFQNRIAFRNRRTKTVPLLLLKWFEGPVCLCRFFWPADLFQVRYVK
jgi:hypothetical protein